MQTVFNGTYMGLNDPRYHSRTEFYQWFHKYVRSIVTLENEGKDLAETAKEWCDNNEHEWREDGVYDMNIMTYAVAFKCAHCQVDIHKNTPAQADCVTNDGNTWFCYNCRKHCHISLDNDYYNSDNDSIASDDSIWGQMQIDMITAGGTENYDDFGIGWQPGWSWDIDHWEWTGMTCAIPGVKPYAPPPPEMKASEMWWGWAGATEHNMKNE